MQDPAETELPEEPELEPGDYGDVDKATGPSKRVIEIAMREELPFKFQIMDESTHTAEAAAAACKCSIDQIGKSIIFKGKATKKPYLFIVSGRNRVNEKAIAGMVGENLEKADADFVKRATGYAIGGVSPLGLANRMPIMMDEHLAQFGRIWIAAGTPNSVMSIPTMVLARTIAARLVKLD